jgi:CopG family nickel-responsive transcriptional regulator
MSVLVRFGVSIDSDLLRQFDDLIGRRRYVNRSEAIRDLLREKLADLQLRKRAAKAVGAVTIVYNHHAAHELSHRLTDLQHDYADLIRSSVHVHLTRDDCLEVIVVGGQISRIVEFSDSLIGTKGVRHGKLSLTVAE